MAEIAEITVPKSAHNWQINNNHTKGSLISHKKYNIEKQHIKEHICEDKCENARGEPLTIDSAKLANNEIADANNRMYPGVHISPPL